MQGIGLRLGTFPRSLVSEYPDAIYYSDFTKNRHRLGSRSSTRSFLDLPGSSYVRPGATRYVKTVAGLLLPKLANELPITDLGLLVEEARTNKCTNTNVNPQSLAGMTKTGDAAATLTLVDDSAALAAIGLTGNVYKLDNLAGSSTAFVQIGGLTGNLNPHTMSIFARVQSIVADTLLRFNLTNAINTGISALAYQRVTLTGTPSSVNDAIQIRVPPGQVVYFILNQLEEGAFATSPIAVNGAAATRGADVPLVAGMWSGPLTLAGSADFGGRTTAGATNEVIAALSDGTLSNRLSIFRQSSSSLAAFRATTSNTTVIPGTVGGVSGGVSIVVQAAEIGRARGGANGALGTSVAPASLPNLTYLCLGVGEALSGAQLNGCLRKVLIYPRAFTDAELQALTA